MGALPRSKHAERRRHKRYAVVGSLHLELHRDDGQLLQLHVQDLSKDGLGVVIGQPVRRNEHLKLNWSEHHPDPIPVKVIWIREVEDEDGAMFHCGLQTQDQSIDLERMARGCESISLDELD